MSEHALEEVTELASHQVAFRELIRAAFASRLGDVAPAYDFHRGWNGGWKCRATIPGKVPLEFALLRTATGALLALPVPMPTGWRTHGVADSTGRSWTVNEEHAPCPVRTSAA
jgi:hypothetical protein